MGMTSRKGILIGLSATNTCEKVAYEMKRNIAVLENVIFRTPKKKIRAKK